MKTVITLLITLLFYSTHFAQSDSTDLAWQNLNLVFLDENSQPIETSIILKSETDNLILELKSDVNGKIDTLLPANNTYVIYLVEKTKKESKQNQLLNIIGLALKFILKD